MRQIPSQNEGSDDEADRTGTNLRAASRAVRFAGKIGYPLVHVCISEFTVLNTSANSKRQNYNETDRTKTDLRAASHFK